MGITKRKGKIMIKPEISPVYVLTEEQYDELINSIDEIEETSFNEGI